MTSRRGTRAATPRRRRHPEGGTRRAPTAHGDHLSDAFGPHDGFGAAVLCAFATPYRWQWLRAEPHLARVAFDEAVRWESPVQTFFRTATTDIRIGGTKIPDGKKILMLLGAADRDPRRWSRSAVFDLSRFGMSPHRRVVRLDAEALPTAWLNRWTASNPPGRHHNNTPARGNRFPCACTRSEKGIS